MLSSVNNKRKRRSLVGACKELLRQVKKHPVLYFMLIPCLAYFVIFKYVPMQGFLIAFKNFRATKGIWGSDWAGTRHFELLFRDAAFRSAFQNTVIISVSKIIVNFVFSFLLALLLNEFRSQKIRGTVQTIIYLPHFLTWVVIGSLLNNMFSLSNGVVNEIIKWFGGNPINLTTNPANFRGVLVITEAIKEGGWNSIIYMAAISSIDTQMYEAACIDGANRWKQMLYITIPSLLPTATIMLILSLSHVLSAGFDQVYVLYNPAVMETGDIIDTLIYRKALMNVNYSYGAAADLLKGLISAALILLTNKIVKLLGGEGMF